MKTIEYKLARLEEQNASLRRKLRHQENEMSRLSVRESQLKEARRIPLLQKRLDATLIEREELECQLAETRSREARLLDEVNLLRTFVKLSENPELAEAARQCAKYERIQEDLKALGEQLRTIATERDEYKKRAFASCEEAEYYRDKCNLLFEEKKGLEKYIRGLLAEQTSITTTTATTTTRTAPEIAKVAAATPPSDNAAVEQCSLYEVGQDEDEPHHADNMEHLWQSLKEERARSEALQEAIDTLYEHRREQRRSRSRERRVCGSVARVIDMDAAEQGGTDTVVQGLRQQLHLAEGECALLRNRWQAIRKQNHSLLERVAEKERAEAGWRAQLHQLSGECDRLKRELDFVLRARSLVSCHNPAFTTDESVNHQNDLTE